MVKPPLPRIRIFFTRPQNAGGGAWASLHRLVSFSSRYDFTLIGLFVRYASTTSRKMPKRLSVSRGPAQCSGWNWTLKKGFESWTMPSFEWSFWLVKRILQPGDKPFDVCTANPWFCDVMKHRCVPSNRHGYNEKCARSFFSLILQFDLLTWLWPRLPYFNFAVVIPAAKAIN